MLGGEGEADLPEGKKKGKQRHILRLSTGVRAQVLRLYC